MNERSGNHMPYGIRHAKARIPLNEGSADGRVEVVRDIEKSEGKVEVVRLKFWGRLGAVGGRVEWS